MFSVCDARKPPSLFAAAFARNHTPIRSDAKRTGATFVTYESPTGDRHNSPHTWNRYASVNHIALAFTPVSAILPPITMKRKPVPSRARPSTIFSAVDGSFPARPSFTQSAANSGANATTKNAEIDWNQLDGIAQPPMFRFV